MKKILVLALTLIMLLGIGSTAMAEGKVFGYTCMTMNNPFFIVLEKSIREAVEANGDKLITVDPSMDVALQISQVEDLIVQEIDAIFLNPVDWEGIAPALDELNKAGIPIINFDAEVKDLDKVTAYVGSNNYNAGYVCGKDLVDNNPDGGNIVVLDSPTMNSVNDRISGFFAALEEAGATEKFPVVHQADALGDLPTAMGIMDDVLQRDIEILAIMGGNDPTALGALASCKAAGRTEIKIYGVDGSPDAKLEISKGGLTGSGAQSPISIGKDSVTVAYKILDGEAFELRTPVNTFMINADNIAEYGVDGWQ